MISVDELVDYLQNRTQPSCTLAGPKGGHYRVSCGRCQVTIPDDGVLTTTTANRIERALEPCLGRNWMP